VSEIMDDSDSTDGSRARVGAPAMVVAKKMGNRRFV